LAGVIGRAAAWLVVIALLVGGYLLGREYVGRHPQDVPWTELRLDDPVGVFTLRKLVALSRTPDQCRALLEQAGAADVPAPARSAGPNCGYANGILLRPADGELTLEPANVVASCPVAAAMLVLERQVIQPAAARHFDSRVAVIQNAGTYSCRRLYGRAEGEFSEHATANAIDVTDFRTEDGTSVSVLRDWNSAGPKAAFLREVRDGACRLFATVLSPDYNAAHADHLHLDQAGRGETGWGVCR